MDLPVRNKSSLFPEEQDDDPSVQPGADPTQPPERAIKESTRIYPDYTLFGMGEEDLIQKLNMTLEKTPRYLFRVIYPESRCTLQQRRSVSAC